jgi:ankyrin repeat protein
MSMCSELGQTALHHCVIRGHVAMVNLLTGGCEGWDEEDPIGAQCKRLFENVIDVNVQDSRGDTPLHIACRDGRKLIVEALCDAGAIPDSIRNKDGK